MVQTVTGPIPLERLGRARKVIVTEDQTTILGGAGAVPDVDARIAQIRAELARTENERDHEHLTERLARLAGRVAVIRVGAATAVELREKQRRSEGALAAARAALEEGVVPGGGVALVNAERVLDHSNSPVSEHELGGEVVRAALSEPLRWIATNAGQEGSIPAYVEALCKEIEYVGSQFPSPREASPHGDDGRLRSAPQGDAAAWPAPGRLAVYCLLGTSPRHRTASSPPSCVRS